MRWKLIEINTGEVWETIFGPRECTSKCGKYQLLDLKSVCFGLGWDSVISMQRRRDGLIEAIVCDNEGYRRHFVIELRHMTNPGEPRAQFESIAA